MTGARREKGRESGPLWLRLAQQRVKRQSTRRIALGRPGHGLGIVNRDDILAGDLLRHRGRRHHVGRDRRTALRLRAGQSPDPGTAARPPPQKPGGTSRQAMPSRYPEGPADPWVAGSPIGTTWAAGPDRDETPQPGPTQTAGSGGQHGAAANRQIRLEHFADDHDPGHFKWLLSTGRRREPSHGPRDARKTGQQLIFEWFEPLIGEPSCLT